MTQLEERLHERNWKMLKKEVIKGAHAGYIYRIQVLDKEDRKSDYIYKEFADDRNNEIKIYKKLSDYIKPFSKLVEVWDTAPQAILMCDLNTPLKEGFNLYTIENKRKLIDSILSRLAALHSLSPSSVAKELPTHQINSDWFDWCLVQLNKLSSQNKWNASEWIKTIENAYKQLNLINYKQRSSFVITHGDPHLENIFYADEQVWFIDWEWAAIGSPLRDITILCQDIYDAHLIKYINESYRKYLKTSNLNIPIEDYQRDFDYLYVDHITMMLAWEIEKYFQGYTSEEEIQRIIAFKIKEIKRTMNEELKILD
ncbi:phosphotransferase family protein [Pseudalkalibacillus caeni]|uniref:Aminoglycoside phosphotransferase domain-containing protein n=1 Tax=Exobacillus caeni TaxID=2574798 RepID=A0A5R9F0J3_9BACL|nr:phosphotransferase [Pseudalkalibacillus caeni]TLS36521.1 hypothetical protein FCL54_15015 [Pseudalkalibacillus caeni]